MTNPSDQGKADAAPAALRISADALATRLRPKVDTLERQRQSVRNGVFVRAGAGIGGGIVIALLLSLFGTGLIVSVLVLVLGAVVGFALANAHANAFKNRAAAALAAIVAAEIGDLDYERTPGALPDADPFFQLKIVPSGNRIRYADRLRGRHRGTDFVLVESTIARRTRSHSAGAGKSRYRSKTVFRGLLVALSVPARFDGTVFIGRDFGNFGNWLSGLAKKFGDMRQVAFPESEFEDIYEVYADNEETAQRLISKEFADAMVRIAGMARGGRPRAAFTDGRFYLALPWRGGFLEPVGVMRPIVLTPEWLREIVDEMTLPHRLIDTLHDA